MLFSASAKFKSMFEYIWYTNISESFFAITLHRGGGGAYFQDSLACFEKVLTFQGAITLETLKYSRTLYIFDYRHLNLSLRAKS